MWRVLITFAIAQPFSVAVCVHYSAIRMAAAPFNGAAGEKPRWITTATLKKLFSRHSSLYYMWTLHHHRVHAISRYFD